MRRLWLFCLLVLCGLLAVTRVVAQQPVTTEEPVPPVIQPTAAPPSNVVQPTVVASPPASVVQPTMMVATLPVETPTTPAIGVEMPILLSARSDLDLLATTLLPEGRPIGWSGSSDSTNPQLALLIRLDLELLVGSVMGADQRPSGWFGAVPSTPYAIARDIRHDLELLADQMVGLNVRPPGWLGGDPLMKCSRATQTLVSFLNRAGVFTLQIDPASPDYCQRAEVQAAQFAEINLLSDPTARGAGILSRPAAGSVTVNSNFAVAFLDRGAELRVGIVPNGTPVTPVARSYAQYSNMMLVQGADFQVFLDYQFTSISEDQFEALPDVATVTDLETNCAAEWCLAG